MIHSLKLQFQGGFVGQDCNILASTEGAVLQVVQAFYPEDINAPQTFSLGKPFQANHIRLVFNKSTDFFGRIIVYKLEILSD